MRKELKLIQEDGDGHNDLELYLAAPALHGIIWGMAQWLRNKTKHAEGDVSQFEEAKEHLWSLIADEDAEKYFR